jgi:hypothetical protein
VTFRSFGAGFLLVLTLVLFSATTTDPDLWGHVRFGQDMIAAGRVTLPDAYSFTSDLPWVNHEWLSEVAMAAAYEQGGPVGLTLLRFGLLLSVLGIVWTSLVGLPDRHKILVVVAGATGMLWRTLPIRPQLFSLLFFAIFLKLIDVADRRKSLRPLLALPLLMAVWVNTHGGWIVGLGVLAIWIGLTAITSSWPRRAALIGILGACVAATLVNPYGYGMWRFILGTVGFDRPVIADWQPLYELPPTFWLPWIVSVGLVLSSVARARQHGKSLVLAIFLGLLSLRVSRLDAFFAIAALFLVARARRHSAAESEVPVTPARRSPALAWGLSVLAIASLPLVAARLRAVPIQPVTVPDAEVGRYVRTHQLKGNVLVWFDWGQYVIWQFGPDLKVSMDGRRETVYSQGMIDAHMRFYFDPSGGPQFAEKLRPDYIWLPASLPVVDQLLGVGWRSMCRGPSSVLLTRQDLTPSCEIGTHSSARRFPDL